MDVHVHVVPRHIKPVKLPNLGGGGDDKIENKGNFQTNTFYSFTFIQIQWVFKPRIGPFIGNFPDNLLVYLIYSYFCALDISYIIM